MGGRSRSDELQRISKKLPLKIISAKVNCLILSLFLVSLFQIGTRAQTVPLAWNPSTSSGVNGYEIAYGTSSGVYTSFVDAGNSTNYTVTGLNLGTVYYFAVAAYSTNASGLQMSPFSNETNALPYPAPVILTEPISLTEFSGATAAFFVVASDTMAMTYQWYFNGNPVAGATTNHLTLSSLSTANAGNYTVVVSSVGGSITSSVAVLSVIAPPVITQQPVSQSAGFGSQVCFHVSVSGTPPFSFQWYTSSGAAIHTATKPTLLLDDVTGANAGSYYCVVQNGAGKTTSSHGTLTITNAYVPLAGSYNGLFYQTNGTQTAVAEATAGMLANCAVGSNGIYSAKLYIAGASYSLSGLFNSFGLSSNLVSRAASGQSNLLVCLSMDLTGQSQMITGYVTNLSTTNPWVAPLVADLATNTLPVAAGTFPIIVPPILNPLDVLTGNGSVTVTTSGNGTVTLSGALDDLTSVSQTVPVSNIGTIPFYCSLYGGQGLVEGWINLANQSPTGTITWIRPPNILTGLLFPAGFTNVLTVN